LKQANLRRKWSTIPKAAAFHNQPSRFTAWRLFVSVAHGSLKSPACSCVLFPNGWTVFEAPAVEKSLKFPELALAVSVEESMKGRVFFRRGTGGAATRRETRNIGLWH
jgi:hypothetical protein